MQNNLITPKDILDDRETFQRYLTSQEFTDSQEPLIFTFPKRQAMVYCKFIDAVTNEIFDEAFIDINQVQLLTRFCIDVNHNVGVSVDIHTGEIKEVKLSMDFEKNQRILGRYYLTFNYDKFKELCKKTDPQIIADYIYLACHGNFKNVIVSRETSRYIGGKRIADMLGRNGDKRLAYLMKERLIGTNGSSYALNPLYVNCGGKSTVKFQQGARLYKDYYMSLYESSNTSERKVIGRIYKMCHSMNIHFNLICDNLYTDSLKGISPFRCQEVVALAGWKKGNDTRHSNELTSLQFSYHDHVYRVMLHGIKESDFCGGYFINPLLFYRGSNIDWALDVRVRTNNRKRIGYEVLADESEEEYKTRRN